MGFFSSDENRLQDYYHKAWHEENMGFVDPRKHSYLEDELNAYAAEHNCSYDEALTLAMTGKKTGRLADRG